MKLIARVLLFVVLLLLFFYVFGRLQAVYRGATVQVLAAEPAVATDALHIATYNIAHGRGADYGQSNWAGTAAQKQARLQAIGEYLQTSGVDIAVLNEVDFNAVWSGGVDQAAVIAQAGSYAYVARQLNYKVNIPMASLAFGNAIVSRYPIRSAELVKFSPFHWYEAVFAGNHDALKVDIDTGAKSISLWALHLEYRDEAVRIAAVQDILQRAGQDVFLAGDLNSRPSKVGSSTALDALLAAAVYTTVPAPDGRQFTFPTKQPSKAIDWIFVPSAWQIRSGWVGSFDQSDHLPVHAIVDARP